MVISTFDKHDLESIIDERLSIAFEKYGKILQTEQALKEPPYVSKKEAARLIGICVASVDNAARAGRLKRHYINGRRAVRFLRSEVLSLAVETKGGNTNE